MNLELEKITNEKSFQQLLPAIAHASFIEKGAESKSYVSRSKNSGAKFL